MRALLMGGQACILYGAAEFSRDVDVAIAIEPRNLERLRAALDDLRGEQVLYPPLSAEALLRGHACHFRCFPRGSPPVRLYVMAVLRGADPFPTLWRRRRCLRVPGLGTVAVMALADLVRVKKTQRDKDWPMVRRLVEADIVAAGPRPPRERVLFWLRECRTPETLAYLVRRFRTRARRLAKTRRALAAALAGDPVATDRALHSEEVRERTLDRRYWAPLRAEIERWRRERAGAG